MNSRETSSLLNYSSSCQRVRTSSDDGITGTWTFKGFTLTKNTTDTFRLKSTRCETSFTKSLEGRRRDTAIGGTLTQTLYELLPW